MSQVKINMNGDLYVIIKEIDEDATLVSYRLSNGAELDFYNDELVQLVLPNFEAQLNRGSLLGLSIDLVDMKINDKKIILSIKIINDVINITLDCSSIINKL